MEHIRRNIRLFFVTYGRLLFYIICIITLIVMIPQWLNKLAIANIAQRQENIIKNQEIIEQEKKEEECITKFIDYSNNKKYKEAYDMISNTCKEEQYMSLQEFKDEYLNKVFNINICDYSISKENEIYNVTLVEDMLITGRIDSIKEQKYKIVKENEKNRIYIIN